jgi:hypothetical protein
VEVWERIAGWSDIKAFARGAGMACKDLHRLQAVNLVINLVPEAEAQGEQAWLWAADRLLSTKLVYMDFHIDECCTPGQLPSSNRDMMPDSALVGSLLIVLNSSLHWPQPLPLLHLRHLWIDDVPDGFCYGDYFLASLCKLETLGLHLRDWQDFCSFSNPDLAWALPSLRLVALKGFFPVGMYFPESCQITWWGTSWDGGLAAEDEPPWLDMYADVSGRVEDYGGKLKGLRITDVGCTPPGASKHSESPNTEFQQFMHFFSVTEFLYLDLVEDSAVQPEHPVICLHDLSPCNVTRLTIAWAGSLSGQLSLVVPAQVKLKELRVAVAGLTLKFEDSAVSGDNLVSMILQYKRRRVSKTWHRSLLPRLSLRGLTVDKGKQEDFTCMYLKHVGEPSRDVSALVAKIRECSCGGCWECLQAEMP